MMKGGIYQGMSMMAFLQRFGGYQPWSDIWVREGWRVQKRHGTGEIRVLDAFDRISVHGGREACIKYACDHAPALKSGPVVVLLHSLARGRAVMSRLEHGLAARGWTVVNVGYPSLRENLAHHAECLKSVITGLMQSGASEFHVVAHSLGGLVALETMSRTADWIPLKLVLVGSPIHGSAWAALLNKSPLYRILIGSCGQSLLPRTGVADFPITSATTVGIIAGGNGGRGYNHLLDGDNDGTVRVEETRLPGVEADFLLLPVTHSFLAQRGAALDAVHSFLLSGRFSPTFHRPCG